MMSKAWVTGTLPRLTPALLADPQEPPWVEVLVEILLSLLAQPSHLMRESHSQCPALFLRLGERVGGDVGAAEGKEVSAKRAAPLLL